MYCQLYEASNPTTGKAAFDASPIHLSCPRHLQLRTDPSSLQRSCQATSLNSCSERKPIMPKAYVLLQFNIDNQETFGRYRQGAAPTILSHGGKVLVGASNTDLREGSLPAGLVTILEFPSREAAEGWYASPEYAAVHHLRTDATFAGSLTFLAGFEPPAAAAKQNP